MKIRTFLILILTTISIIVQADGLPIINGELSIPHIKLKLSSDQVIQAGVFRYIELNEFQKKQLRDTTNRYIPNLLRVVTAPYNDCSCGMIFYGLWSDNYEVQVPKRGLDDLELVIEEGLLEEAKNLNELSKNLPIRVLNINLNGDIYQNGKIVNNLAQSISKINEDKPEYGDGKYIFVNTPPLRKDEVIDKVISSYKNLYKYYTDNGFELYAFFENEYINFKDQGFDELPEYLSKSINIELEKLLNGCSLQCGTSWTTNASSTAKWKDKIYSVDHLTDTLLHTSWVENIPGHGIGESITLSSFRNKSSKDIKINGLIIANGFQKNEDLFLKNSRVKSFLLEVNDQPAYMLHLVDNMGFQMVSFPEIEINSRDTLKLIIIDIFGGIKYQDTSVTMLFPKFEM